MFTFGQAVPLYCKLSIIAGGNDVSEEEVELVAELLARVGGAWYPERTKPALRPVSNRHREVARLILDAVERSKAAEEEALETGSPSDATPEGRAFSFAGEDQLHVGATVVYRPLVRRER
ncbi:hypothetical protein C4E04_06945 [Microvirga sp. 17 mud 1-3]|nr:hypothetical protein C4E04_06945 [Microvirga sp. 17 mud 1-3]